MGRPALITLLGWASVLLGGLRLAGWGLSSLGIIPPDWRDPVARVLLPPLEFWTPMALPTWPLQSEYERLSRLGHAIAAGMLLTGGAGLLRLQAWGPSLALASAGVTLFLAVVGAAVFLWTVVIPIAQFMGGAALRSGTLWVAWRGVVVGPVYHAAYPVLLLWVLTRWHVREWFHDEAPAIPAPTVEPECAE